MTAVSTDGSLGLYYGNANSLQCQGWVAGLAFQTGETLRVNEISACAYTVTPLTPLAPGRYCLPPLPQSDEPPRCIEVTGRAPDLQRGTVRVQLLYEATGMPLSCHACEGDGSQV